MTLLLYIVILVLFLLVLYKIVRVATGTKHTIKAKITYPIDWDALADTELRGYLPNQKIAAIKRYRELTGSGLKEAKDTIDRVVSNPELLDKAKNPKRAAARLADVEGAGVRNLIAEGKISEAVQVYADFMGVDEFTARAAIERMASNR